jgi:hypothetical protein
MSDAQNHTHILSLGELRAVRLKFFCSSAPTAADTQLQKGSACFFIYFDFEYTQHSAGDDEAGVEQQEAAANVVSELSSVDTAAVDDEHAKIQKGFLFIFIFISTLSILNTAQATTKSVWSSRRQLLLS